jgi:hypothetical protein
MQTIENIKEKAEVAGYTITDVARHAGFHPAQVSDTPLVEQYHLSPPSGG